MLIGWSYIYIQLLVLEAADFIDEVVDLVVLRLDFGLQTSVVLLYLW